MGGDKKELTTILHPKKNAKELRACCHFLYGCDRGRFLDDTRHVLRNLVMI